MNVFRDLVSLISLNATLSQIYPLDSLYLHSTIAKLAIYTFFYTHYHYFKRIFNGMFQRLSQLLQLKKHLEKFIISIREDPINIYMEIANFYRSRKCLEYITRDVWITERSVYELARKLKKIRRKIYGL